MISAVVLTKNEEKNIVDCLESLNWCSEIIVIDDYSTDRTAELCQQMGAKVYKRKLSNNFSEQRDFGLLNVSNEWALFVDADERVSKNLADEIQNNIKKTARNGFIIRRYDVMWGKKLEHGETGDIWFLRLGKINTGRWQGNVHEEWKINNYGKLKNSLIHYPHQTVEQFLKEINYYTDLRAKELLEKKVNVSVIHIVLFPKAKFILNYFLKLGFLDGLEGLVFAIIMSFHSFLTRAKLWQLKQTSRRLS